MCGTGILAQLLKPLLVMLAPHTVAPFLIQIYVNSPLNAVKDGPSAWPPALPVGDIMEFQITGFLLATPRLIKT